MQSDNPPLEYGSEFHWVEGIVEKGPASYRSWGTDAVFSGSGRDALRSIMKTGRTEFGWRRVLLPSYYCMEVAESIVHDGFDIAIYPDDPRMPISAPCSKADEAVLVVNTYGIREAWKGLPGCKGGVIEDHTHDPWSQWAVNSVADYCFASLRKTLPIPDGAVAWSPTGKRAPSDASFSETHQRAALRKFEAMILKTHFLQGKVGSKQLFRQLALDGEAEIAVGEISAIEPISSSIIETMNCLLWRKKRKENYIRLSGQLRKGAGLDVISPIVPNMVPFSVVMICEDQHQRSLLRNRLIEKNVYPAILWPLRDSPIPIPPETIALSDKLLSLHCDGRYGNIDMDRIAAIVRESVPC